jgi:hypothetical protein
MLSQFALAASAEMNDAMIEGADMIEAAKMTGITPAELILMGRKDARAIEALGAAFSGMLDRDLPFREFREDHEARNEDHGDDIERELEAAFDHLARTVVHVVANPLSKRR